MTQQDDITQRLNEIHADAGYLFGRVAADGACAGAMAESVRARIDAIKALLSKLRAPVAESTDRAMLQSVLQDLEKSESVCPRCGYGDSCADMDVAHMIRDHLKGDASAPVAGEAVTWEAVRQELAIFLMGATGRSSKEWHRPLDNASEGGALARMRACLAAPQASAEDVRNAALEEAYEAVACLYAAYYQHSKRSELDAILQALKQAGDDIRALKQPQADKDGGQQRAGEVDERAAFEAWAYRAGMGPKFRESMFAAWEARAALSAPQAEQGERDA
ncbi:hypothetical protein ACOTH0_15430 [Achromobacter xylosoxidans]